MFSPRQLFRQVVIISAVQLLIMAGVAMQETGNSLVRFLSKAEREQKEIEDDLSRAVSYREWKEVAGKLDFTRGNDKWRLQDESSLYDCNVLRKRIDDTMEMAKQGDVFRLMFRLRGGLARDQYGNILFTLSFIYQLSIWTFNLPRISDNYSDSIILQRCNYFTRYLISIILRFQGMQHEGLFSRAISGTKVIVEQYHESVAYALDFICDSQVSFWNAWCGLWLRI